MEQVNRLSVGLGQLEKLAVEINNIKEIASSASQAGNKSRSERATFGHYLLIFSKKPGHIARNCHQLLKKKEREKSQQATGQTGQPMRIVPIPVGQIPTGRPPAAAAQQTNKQNVPAHFLPNQNAALYYLQDTNQIGWAAPDTDPEN